MKIRHFLGGTFLKIAEYENCPVKRLQHAQTFRKDSLEFSPGVALSGLLVPLQPALACRDALPLRILIEYTSI